MNYIKLTIGFTSSFCFIVNGICNVFFNIVSLRIQRRQHEDTKKSTVRYDETQKSTFSICKTKTEHTLVLLPQQVHEERQGIMSRNRTLF